MRIFSGIQPTGRKHLGTVVGNAAQLEAAVARGIRYIAWLSDLGMMRGALTAAAANFTAYRTGETR